MKARINLHNYNTKGRIDTYQFREPYTTQRPAINKQDTIQRLASSAYASNYNQACLLLQAIQLNRRQRLSQQCISHLATYVTRAWEADPSQSKIEELIKLMTNLLNTTGLYEKAPLDQALKQFCRNPVAVPTVCPSVTLLVAVSYIERLKQKYTSIKGTQGCGYRLIMVAYMMAAKFLQTNLRSIINTTAPSYSPPPSPPPPPPQLSSISARLSSERSTLKQKIILPLPDLSMQPISPPTSPKSLSDYHFFPERKNNNTPPPARNYGVMRMELEFLHFLNYDLGLNDATRLVRWAHQFVDEPTLESYSSADEGGDEMGHDDEEDDEEDEKDDDSTAKKKRNHA
ncbi:hypothetical protein DFQ28_001374 [Apophysomyces sp. BC1034]|nr:hypothetical protein DFQ30_001643 [Apophysomyces sp. BC1015]KAG0178356.1 hypothetical protein DFQ29_003590 [Apophysomyces sp. BC1021]KAG0190893.1 hypothetical protein DFQ28_001374 [Apophysomyces sp. BC1034]